ncbi:DUF6542 domain-containing protein [Streptomyces winkii]|uniref:DUF6542 domain-containing protein n=1 Tax=Streptomyces winkii TaxID=3051178 RepID=UPI0028CFFAAE|nr:DUF6542 domain-containing protein [Streptomyces sp. DSM 40971]
MEQQHSAHTGGKDPGQGPGQGQEPGQSQGHSQNEGQRQRRPRSTAPRAAAAAAAGPPASPPVSSARTPDSASGAAAPAGRERRRRPGGGAGAVRQEAAALYQAQLRFPLIPAPLTDAVSWLPRARLTALGSGLLGVLLMLLAGAADRWLLGGTPAVYGGAFLVVCVACAAWVRPTDLVTAPVAAPLAFTSGLFFISGGAGDQGIKDRLTNLFPVLAVNAVWLYAGTLLAVLIVTMRKIALMVQQSRVRALMEAEDAEDEAAAEADKP